MVYESTAPKMYQIPNHSTATYRISTLRRVVAPPETRNLIIRCTFCSIARMLLSAVMLSFYYRAMFGDELAVTPESKSSPTMLLLGSRGLHEFIRYAAASGIALAADVGVLSLLTSIFGVSYLVSGALGFLVGLVVVYILSVRWVFEQRVFRDWRSEFLMFAFIGIVGLFLNEVILWILTGQLGLFYLLSKAVSVAVVFSWNFGVRKRLLFRVAKVS